MPICTVANRKSTGKSDSAGTRASRKTGARAPADKKKTATKRSTASKPKAKTKGITGSKTRAHAPRKSAGKAPIPPSHGGGFPVVAVGASAGGLEAMEELFNHMPVDSGMAFVVVTHQHPGHTSLLPELLDKETDMPVTAAEDGTRLQPNHVYVGPSGGHLAILHGTLHRMEADKEESPRLPIDYFFRSLAEDQQEKAIGIVLSGTGTDGTLGLKAIKGASGMAMVQEPQSAKYAGMPSSAIATGLADYVLPPDAMSKHLVAYARGPYLQAAAVAAETPAVPEEPMQKIFVLLRSRTGNDFSAYKSTTLRRRIERRMNVHQISKPDQYVRYLQENPHEIDFLFKELLISVTNFFRDPEAWEALAGEPLEGLLRSRPEDYTFRAWVPGCATGEEAFSAAIVLRECMDRAKRHLDVQIFGTDLDAEAVDLARGGQFPDGIASDVSPERLKRYFVRDEGAYRIRNEIREMTIFAPQNVIKDPPFTKLDMICCRNLLIYLNTDLQKKLLPIFHYALKPGGLLFLGPSETTGVFDDLFETVHKRWKIFRRKENPAAIHALPEIPAQPVSAREDETAAALAPPPIVARRLSHVIERLLLGRFAPPGVVVDSRGDIVYIHGRTGSYLEPATGQPRNNVLEMAREGLHIELASALREAGTTADEVTRENVRVKSGNEFTKINLTVSRIQDPEAARGLFLVTFRPVPAAVSKPRAARKRKPAGAGENERLDQLERELQYTRESLQSTVEEWETSNEELKSTNEELQSTNEELQSTNEELETSKEEMQSLNEELTTVNAELQSKVDELSQANNDMQNLLNSTDIATVFLDNDLNVKRYTQEARKLVKLIPTDIGRPIADLASSLKVDDLAASCREVLRTLVYKEREVETTGGSWYLMRIMPYRTVENVIEGLVLTFVSIDELKQIEEKRGLEARSLSESIVETVREPLVILDDSLHVISANHAFYRTFKTAAKQTTGTLIYELGSGQWNLADLRNLLENVLPKNQSFQDYEVEAEFPKIGRRIFVLNGRRLEQKKDLPGMILLALEEVTGA